jgi:hypothetical protein
LFHEISYIPARYFELKYLIYALNVYHLPHLKAELLLFQADQEMSEAKEMARMSFAN